MWAPQREASAREWDTFIGSRHREWSEQRAMNPKWKLGVVAYLGMTEEEYSAWVKTGLVNYRVRRIWQENK